MGWRAPTQIMNNKAKIKVFLGIDARLSPAQVQRLNDLSDRIETFTLEDAERNQDLLGEIEVYYGKIRPHVWPKTRRLRWVHISSVGAEWTAKEVLNAEGEVILTNSRGIFAPTMVEHMFGLVLMHTRGLADVHAMRLQNKGWRETNRAVRQRLITLSGKTLGVLGVGTIGRQAARVGRAMGMNVIGCRLSGASDDTIERMYTPQTRLEFFRQADVMMVSLPTTDQTRHFVCRETLAVIKPGAILANVGRGKTVDTEALIEALREGRLGAAVFDVTDPEPLKPDHPLWTMKNVYFTPHISSLSVQLDELTGSIFLENLERYLRGEELMNVVDPHKGY
jgi:D-2-hydroxyacid dehydrogenase (NADP+)